MPSTTSNSTASSSSSSGDNDTDSIALVEPAFRPFFWMFAACATVLLYFAMGYARKYKTMAAFLLPPFICACIIFDNVVMATTGLNHDKPSVQAMLAFHSCVIPMILLVCYELAYLVHKQKSVNFCGISFESGHRRMLGRNALSTCLRFAVWLIGLSLLVMNLLVSYNWHYSNSETPASSLYDMEGDSTTHIIFAVAPALVLVILSLYIGLQLWNYGTFYSYMVHATCFNPWIWMLVGSVCLLAGYLMPTPLYALTSNAGELVMLATIIRMFREVHHDIQQGLQMRSFIDPIATVSPQSHSRSGLISGSYGHGQGGGTATGAGAPGKYSPMNGGNNGGGASGPPGGAGGGAHHGIGTLGSSASATYLEVLTPRDHEEPFDDGMSPIASSASHHHRLGASATGTNTTTASSSSSSSHTFLSVVVSSTRTNPLFE